MLYKRRSRFKELSEKTGKFFSNLPLTANQWTGLSLVLSVVTFFMLLSRNFPAAAAIFALTAFIDMIDGAVARAKKSATKLGGYLDSVTDRVIEFTIILGLFMVGYPSFILPSSIWLFLLFFGSFMSTYTRAAAFEKQVYKDLKGGILEHTDRLVVFMLIIIVSAFSTTYASYLIVVMALLTNVSAVQRFAKAVKG